MRVLMVTALLFGAAFMLLFVLAEFARALLRHSFQAPPDLDDSEDWEIAADAFRDRAPPVAQPPAVGRYPGAMRGDDISGKSNALDDLRSAL